MHRTNCIIAYCGLVTLGGYFVNIQTGHCSRGHDDYTLSHQSQLTVVNNLLWASPKMTNINKRS